MTDTEMLDWQERNPGFVHRLSNSWYARPLGRRFHTLREAIRAMNGIREEGDEKCNTQFHANASNAEGMKVASKAVEVTKTADSTKEGRRLTEAEEWSILGSQVVGAEVIPFEQQNQIQQLTRERDELFLTLGGMQDAIAEGLNTDRTATTEPAVRALLKKLTADLATSRAQVEGWKASFGHKDADFQACKRTIDQLTADLAVSCKLRDSLLRSQMSDMIDMAALCKDLTTSQARVEVLEEAINRNIPALRWVVTNKTDAPTDYIKLMVNDFEQALAGKGDV